MEVRCGSCNKPFRISDDKITGKGIKFACTRCGGSVRITKEEFEHYILSKTAVSTLDLFETTPKTKPAGVAPVPDKGHESAPSEQQGFDLSAQTEHENVGKEHPPHFIEPAAFNEPASVPGPRIQQGVEQKTEPAIEPGPNQKTGYVQPKTVTKPAMEPTPEAAQTTATSVPLPEPAVSPAPVKKEYVHTVSPAMEISTKEKSPAPSRAGRMFLLLAVTVILIGLAGYGLFAYLQAADQKSRNAAPEMTSIEGLQIVNASGTMEPTGDLLITGVVENATDKDRAAWYVVADIYDAQGAVMTKIRLLNGKQLYTLRDYDILAKRGVNIQDLKTKSLQEQGVVIPPKGSVNFEMRYLQPPIGIASFNATLQPFDPVRLYKEIAEDVK